MFWKLRNRVRQAVARRLEIKIEGFELDLTPEDVIADLNFGGGPTAKTARSVPDGRPEVRSVA